MTVQAAEGLVIIAGQAAETAEQFQHPQTETDEMAASLRLLRDLGPARVYFSHDHAIWESSRRE